MVKYILAVGLLLLSVQAFSDDAPTSVPVTTVVEKLDNLDQQRILLQKEIDVAKLQGDLQNAQSKAGTSAVVLTKNLSSSNLRLVKVTGLESEPEAVFLYNGYRLVSYKGAMVLPEVQLRVVEASHVVLKDIKTGSEFTLWLSNDAKNGSTNEIIR